MQQVCVRLRAVGIFTPKKTMTAEVGSAPIKAAAGASMVGSFLSYTTGTEEQRALSIPTISRAISLMGSVVGSLELEHYSKQWNGEEYDEVYLPTEPWMERPDPKVTRNFIMTQTFIDLFLHGRSFWYVTSRYSTGLPASFTWLPASSISTPNQQGPQFYGQADVVMFNGVELPRNDVIQFLAPTQGILYSGARTMSISLHLDQAADRYATLETVPGYLQQKGGETMSGDELGDLAAAWAAARRNNAIGALNDYVEFIEYKTSPAETVASLRQYQALESARIAGVPPYLVGVATGGMTYQNAQESRQDLYLFGVAPYIQAIQETLSMENVLPRNRFVKFDIDDYLNQVEELDVSMPTTQEDVTND